MDSLSDKKLISEWETESKLRTFDSFVAYKKAVLFGRAKGIRKVFLG